MEHMYIASFTSITSPHEARESASAITLFLLLMCLICTLWSCRNRVQRMRWWSGHALKSKRLKDYGGWKQPQDHSLYQDKPWNANGSRSGLVSLFYFWMVSLMRIKIFVEVTNSFVNFIWFLWQDSKACLCQAVQRAWMHWTWDFLVPLKITVSSK